MEYGGGTLVFGVKGIPLLYDWVPYHYGWFLVLMFVLQPILMVGIQSTPEQYTDHSYNPGAWYLVYLATKFACNDAGDEIIYVYV